MQGNPTYRLVVRRGPQPNQVYELTGDVTNIGRDITNDIVINDREVSRHHMRFMRGSDGYTIEDLGSTNGTFVNGKRVSGATPIKNGDMIGLGETVTLGFEVKRPGQAEEAASREQTPPEPQQTVPSESGNQPEESQEQQYAPRRADQPQPARSDQQRQNPYQRPADQAQQRPQPAYQQQESYQQPQQAQGYDEGGSQQGYYAADGGYGPPPPGYDYDPYAMGAEEGNTTMRWVLFGCMGLMLFCCCITIISIVIIDTFVLYCDIPVLRDVLEALGLLQCAV